MTKRIFFFSGLMVVFLLGIPGIRAVNAGCNVRSDDQYVDGCSGPWLPNVHVSGLDIDLKKLFRPACDNHDRCYHSCGCTKDECDNAFKNQMDDICERNYPYNPVTIMGHNVGDKNAVHRAACHLAADMFYDAVRAGGQSSYDADQHRAGCK
ncbi:MAG: hypothetical protein JW821_12665 [Deltaproteobacteria bacterium]|nr:hypothetical protein [Deltaproteobacteria bacterium]